MDVGGSERDVRSQQRGQAADTRADARASRPSERRAGSGRLGSGEWGRLLASPRRLPRRTETRPAAATSSFPPINSSSAAPRPSSHALVTQARSRSVAAPVCASTVLHSTLYATTSASTVIAHMYSGSVRLSFCTLNASSSPASTATTTNRGTCTRRSSAKPAPLRQSSLSSFQQSCSSPHAPRNFPRSQTPAGATRTPTPSPRTRRCPRSSWDSLQTTGVDRAVSLQSTPVAHSRVNRPVSSLSVDHHRAPLPRLPVRAYSPARLPPLTPAFL